MKLLRALVFIPLLLAAPAFAYSAEPAGRFFSIGGLNGSAEGHEIEAEFGIIAVSTDGRSWKPVFRGGMVTKDFSHANNNLIRGIAYGKGRFVAVGNPGIGVLVSDDGESWKHVTKLGDRIDGFNVAYGNGAFVIARAGDMIRSEDGLAWTRHETPVEGRSTWGENGLGHMRQVAFGNGVFVCLGDLRIATTRDGKAYEHVAFHTPSGRYEGRHSILFGGGKFLWLRSEGHQWSSDGIEWHPLVIDAEADERARTTQATGAVWTGERFLIAGGKDTLYASADGETWEKLAAPGYNRPVAAAGDLIVGKDQVSIDGGLRWERTAPGVPQREIVFLPGP